jgi:sphingolipid 4-desaturase/C4-monooxygenase
MAETQKRNDFYWSDVSHPHNIRRREILKKHPEVRNLTGPDIRLAIVTVLLVAIQLVSAYFASEFNFWLVLLYSYIVGATVNHALFLAIHEITHNMAFRKQTANNWFSFFANLPIVFPYAMSFKVYHTMHHRGQGVDGIDVDVPAIGEAKLFKGFFGKALWMFIQIFFYAFRPMFIKPIKLGKWHLFNFLFQLAGMVVLVYFAGWMALVYLLICDFFAGSIHPMSGHFIAEHYVFKEGQETYSYYGPLNKLAFNVGYHNEHHDFPSIPGYRLPQLKKIAPEYYDNLAQHKSWTRVIFDFIFKADMSLFSRVKRKPDTMEEVTD